MTRKPYLVDDRHPRASRSSKDNLVESAIFFNISVALFAAAAALTTTWCRAMSAMPGMPMPGGWTMSMAWTRMGGHSWAAAGASFVGMWLVMMVAMMLPSATPFFWRYHQAISKTANKCACGKTVLLAAGYFFIWTVSGIAVLLAGSILTGIEMRQPAFARAVPILTGAIVLLAGLLQFTGWKARQLACRREILPRDRTRPPSAFTAWVLGLRLGVDCFLCCCGFTAILVVSGVMSLRMMVIVGAAITVERLVPVETRAVQIIGALIGGAGVVLIARAVAGVS